MRVLVCHRPPAAFGYISDGWINAIRAAGYVAERWDGKRESWDNFQPDLYIGCSGHRQPIPLVKERGLAKIAIHVNPYCDTNIDGINETQDAINWTLKQQPDCVFGYGHDSDRHYWGHWTSKHQIPWAPMPTAGDSTIYRDFKMLRDIDVGYVGGYWPYKAKNLDKYLRPALDDNNNELVAKSYILEARGWGDWPKMRSYKGPITDQEVTQFLNRVKVGPCVTEPHTTKWGIDLPERAFKVALCGALVVHDPVVGLERFIPSVMMAGSPEEYRKLIMNGVMYYNDTNMIARQQKQKLEVLRNHTYFSRVATLFMTLHTADSSSKFGNSALQLISANDIDTHMS